MKFTAATIAGIVAALLLIVGLSFFGLEMKRYFKPRSQAIDRQVFENTPSFVHGKTQYINRLRREYVEAETVESKRGLRDLILSEADAIDHSLLPYDLQQFLNTL